MIKKHNPVHWLGYNFIKINRYFGEFLSLIFSTFKELGKAPYRFKETVQQIYFIANESLFVIVICVCFAAMVTILESSFHMKLVIQNDSLVPGFAALLILRELGAVISGLLLTSRIGAGMTAEIATMKVTEQIEALQMLGVRPINYLVTPRFIASLFGGLIITLIANLVCLFAAQIIAELYLGFSFNMFLSALKRFADFQDLIFAGIKGAVFGGIIPLVSCYFGFKCEGGAEQVGKATTRSVVTSSILIIIADFILTTFFTRFY